MRARWRSDVSWLFFDMGSTLIDESAVWEARIRDTLRLNGRPQAEYEAFDRALACAMRERRPHAFRVAMAELGIADAVPWPGALEKPYPQALALLGDLSARYRLGIIANQLPGAWERLCAWGLSAHIALCLASAEEGLEKPDPALFLRALDRAGCPAARAVMIGDRLDNDVAPARALGMRTVFVRQGYGAWQQPTGKHDTPDATVSGLDELRALLLD